MKRSIVFAGAVAVSLSTLIFAAEEKAPAANASDSANAPTQVVEEESVTVVAVPAVPGMCAANAKCATPKRPPDAAKHAAKKCPPDGKTCADGKTCTPAACPDKEYSDDDFALAYQLMELCNEPQNIENANALLIEAQMQQIPMLRPAQPAFQNFFNKHCSYAAMKKDLARIHLGVFTRDELRKIIDFFHTPEGRKLAANHTELMHKSMELREKRIHDNLPELQQNVQTAMEACMNPSQPPVAQTQPQN